MFKYKEIRDNRLIAKKNKDLVTADALKIVVNSAYGKMNFEHHWLYDPLQAYKVTVNGQLYLMMLSEKLLINDIAVISKNTDGILCKIHKSKLETYYKICKEWEQETNFELEFTNYNLYARRDVNTYIAITDKGKIKQKGDFVIDTPLQKGVDKKIIAIALQNYFIHNKSIKDTIMNHINIYDFCTAQKTDVKFTTEYHYLKDSQLQVDTMQKTNRFFISRSGGILFKVDKKENKYINFCVGRQVTIFNNYVEKPMSEYNIDYGYYISETQKIIDLIIPPQLTLF